MTDFSITQVFATRKAWDLIGFDGSLDSFDRESPEVQAQIASGEVDTSSPFSVRVKGGRTLYEAVGNDGGERVRLSRLAVEPDGLHAVVRYVDADTEIEVIPDAR